MERSILIKFADEAVSVPVPFVENGRDWSGWDCWGLVIQAYSRLGVDLSVYESIETKEVMKSLREFKQQAANWTRYELGQEKPWDLVHIRPVHMGIVVKPGFMIHVVEGFDTCVVSYRGPVWVNQIEGFYRHADVVGM